MRIIQEYISWNTKDGRTREHYLVMLNHRRWLVQFSSILILSEHEIPKAISPTYSLLHRWWSCCWQCYWSVPHYQSDLILLIPDTKDHLFAWWSLVRHYPSCPCYGFQRIVAYCINDFELCCWCWRLVSPVWPYLQQVLPIYMCYHNQA